MTRRAYPNLAKAAAQAVAGMRTLSRELGGPDYTPATDALEDLGDALFDVESAWTRLASLTALALRDPDSLSELYVIPLEHVPARGALARSPGAQPTQAVDDFVTALRTVHVGLRAAELRVHDILLKAATGETVRESLRASSLVAGAPGEVQQ